MKLTKKLIKKLVMESLEESPLGGSPTVDSMTVTDPSSDTGENATLHKLEDGSFKLYGQGGEITLSPKDMENLVAQYEEAVRFDKEHGSAEPEATVQEMEAEHLREGRVTKSALQSIIKEEYKKLTEGYGGYAGGGARNRGYTASDRYKLNADPAVGKINWTRLADVPAKLEKAIEVNSKGGRQDLADWLTQFLEPAKQGTLTPKMKEDLRGFGIWVGKY